MSTLAYSIPDERLFDRLTSAEINTMKQKDQVLLIQPCGATEQHGPHLPLSVDTKIGLAVLARAIRSLGSGPRLYCLPELAYGTSPEHLAFPGTISLSLETYIAVIRDIVRSLYVAGFRRVMLLSSHGGQVQLLEMLGLHLKQEFPELQLFPLFLWNAPISMSELVGTKELRLGIHAGDIETSIMRSIAPELVRFENAVCEYPKGYDETTMFGLSGQLTRSWSTAEISDSGVLGDATAATEEKGKQIIAMLSAAWATIIAEACKI